MLDLPRAFLLIGREVREQRFTPRVESFGVASGVVRFDWDTMVAKEVPAELRAKVDAARDSIAAGTLNPLGPAR